jgi:hypothetical protein
VCSFVSSPSIAAHGIVQLISAGGAPLNDTDATHSLVLVVVATLLDVSQVSVFLVFRFCAHTSKTGFFFRDSRFMQRVDSQFVDTLKQLVDAQLLSRARLQAALGAPGAGLLSIERLLLLSRAHLVDAVVYAKHAFESPARGVMLRDRLVHACTTRAGAQAMGVALVGMLLASDARASILDHLLATDALQQDELLLRFVGCAVSQLRALERAAAADAAAALLERMCFQRDFSVMPFAPLPPTTATLARHRDAFAGARELLGVERLVDVCSRAVAQAVNNQRWSVLLPTLRDVVAASSDACAVVAAALDRSVAAASDSVDRTLMRRCIVVARAIESNAEHATHFGSYGDWIGAVARSSRRERFVTNCLCDMAPHDTAAYLSVHERVMSVLPRELATAFRDAATATIQPNVGDAVDEILAAKVMSIDACIDRVTNWRAARADWFERMFVPQLIARTTWRSRNGRRRADDIVLVMCSRGLLDSFVVFWHLSGGDAGGGTLVAAVRDSVLKDTLLADSSDDTQALYLLACVCAVPALLVPRDGVVTALATLASRITSASFNRALESILCTPTAPTSTLWSSDYALQTCALVAHARGALGGIVARLANTSIASSTDALWFVRRCAALWDAAIVATTGACEPVPGRVVLLLSWLGARLQASTASDAQCSVAVAQIQPYFSSSRMCAVVRRAGKLRRPLPLRCVIEFELALADDATLTTHERAVWLRLGVAHALVREFRGDRALLCQVLLDALVRHPTASRATAYALFVSALQQHGAAVERAWAIDVLVACRSDRALVQRCVDALLLLPPAALLGAAPSARDVHSLARWLCGVQRDFDLVLMRRDLCAHVASALLAHHATQPSAVEALMRWPPLLASLAVEWARVSSAVLAEPRASTVFAEADAIAALLVGGASGASLPLALPLLRASPAAAGAALGLNALEPGAAPLDAVLALLDKAPSAAVHAFCYAVAGAFALTPARHENENARRVVRTALLHFASTLSANNRAAAHLASRFSIAFRATKLLDPEALAAVSISATANDRWKTISETISRMS